MKYRLYDEMVCEFFRSIRILAEVDMIKRHFLEGKQGMEPVNRDSLLKRVIEGRITV